MLFDTEQSKYHVLKVVRRICRLCGIDDPPNLIVYSLRPYSPADRLKLIDFALNNTSGIGLAVIDGVRDLAIDPILDNEEASHIITHLLKWTTDLQIHIMTVLHQNKADRNVRGVLGTELVNKSESVIEVIRDDNESNISHVEPKDCRNQDFPPFSFLVDDHGLPQLVEDDNCRNGRTNSMQNGTSRPGKAVLPTVDNMTTDAVDLIVKRAFTQQQQLAYGQLKTNIIEAAQHAGISLSEGRARSFIQRIVLDGKLITFRPDKARWDYYKLSQENTLI